MIAGPAEAGFTKGLSRVRGNSQALVLRGLPSSNGGRLLDMFFVSLTLC